MDPLGSESLSVTGGATARLALSGKQSRHFTTDKPSGLSEPRLPRSLDVGERPFPRFLPRPGLPTRIPLSGRVPAGQPPPPRQAPPAPAPRAAPLPCIPRPDCRLRPVPPRRRVQVRGREEVHPGAGPEGAAAGVHP